MRRVRERLPRGDELRAMARLALPVVAVQLGLMAMGVVDTIMVGRLSAEALAGVALGHLYFAILGMGGVGVLLALDPIIAQAVGAGDEEGVARGLQRGLLLAVLLTVVVAALLVPAGPLLRWLRQPAEAVPLAHAYLQALIPGIYPFLAFGVLRQGLQATGHMAPIVATVLVANVANVVLNWIFIFGALGGTPLGAVGSAHATSICRWLMTLGLVWLAWPRLRAALTRLRPEVLRAAPLARVLRIGIPIGAQYIAEISAFGMITLFSGWLGTVAMAGHEIALNLASVTFMVPLGVATAASVRVGHAVGRGDAPAAKREALAALAIGTLFMCASALAFQLFPGALARAYATDPAVVALAASLIPIAGVFQIFDGLQAVSGGVLRGIADTRVPFVVHLLGFWAIGMPVSYLLGFRAGMGAPGLWWGLVAGLGVVGLVLLARVRARLRRDVRRLVIDHVRDQGVGGHAELGIP